MTSNNREHTFNSHEEDEFEEADVDPDDRIRQNDLDDRDDKKYPSHIIIIFVVVNINNNDLTARRLFKRI